MVGPEGVVSKYPPAPAYFAAPVYWATQGLTEPSPVNLVVQPIPERPSDPPSMRPVWPAALVSVITTVGTVFALAVAFLRTERRPDLVIVSVVALALGTTIWSVASRQLFSHTTAILGIAAGMALTTRRSYWAAGLAFGLAVASRPHAAVIALVVGVWLAWRRRSPNALLGIGIGSSLGLVAVLGYSATFLSADGWGGTATDAVSVGYSVSYLDRLLQPDLAFFATNLLGGPFSLRWGVFVWSGFLIIPLLWLRPAWRDAPDWVRSAAVGGILYLLIQFAIHRYNPGNQTLYRYPLEAIVASAPLLYVAWTHAAHSRLVQAITAVLLAFAIVLQIASGF